MTASPKSKIPILPSEIWLKIIKLLHWDSPSSVKVVALVDRRLHRIAAAILFKFFCLAVKSDMPKNWEYYSSFPWRYVKVIIVTGASEIGSVEDWGSFGLLKMIESAKSLQEFYWKEISHMPGFILHTLSQLYPDVSVHVTGRNVCLEQRRRPHKPVELSAPQLRCIRYLSSYWDGEWDELSKTSTSTSYQARLKDIICASPNLETLKLFQTIEPATTHRGIISLQKGDTMPQLKHLHLSNMHFDRSQSLLWADSLQWEQLNSLSLLNGNWSTLAPLITGRLRNLRSLEVSISHCNPKLTDWHDHPQTRVSEPPPIYWERATQVHHLLESFFSLETFSGYHLPQYILRTLSSHHALRHLRFRSNSQRTSRRQSPFPPSIKNLASLPEMFPKLKSLGLDLDWDDYEEWPYDMMDKIRKIKNLQHLEINLPGVDPEQTRPSLGEFPIHSIGEAACLRLLQFFEEHSDCEPLSLRSLHVKMGEWESDKWNPDRFDHAMGPLVIGERHLSGTMQVYRFLPQIRHSERAHHKPNSPRDDYRIILELHSLYSPFVRDGGSFASVPYNSEWAASA